MLFRSNPLLGQFSRLGIKELYQTPVLDDSVLHGNLTVGWVLDGGEDVPEGCHVSVLWKKIVNVKAFAVERAVIHMAAGQPVNLQI